MSDSASFVGVDTKWPSLPAYVLCTEKNVIKKQYISHSLKCSHFSCIAGSRNK